MRFYRGNHRYYCGVDLHARTMYLCLTDHQGTVGNPRDRSVGAASQFD